MSVNNDELETQELVHEIYDEDISYHNKLVPFFKNIIYKISNNFSKDYYEDITFKLTDLVTLRVSIMTYHNNIIFFPFVSVANILWFIFIWTIIIALVSLLIINQLVIFAIILVFYTILTCIYYMIVLIGTFGCLILNIFCCCLPIIISLHKILHMEREDISNIKKNINTVLTFPLYHFFAFVCIPSEENVEFHELINFSRSLLIGVTVVIYNVEIYGIIISTVISILYLIVK